MRARVMLNKRSCVLYFLGSHSPVIVIGAGLLGFCLVLLGSRVAAILSQPLLQMLAPNIAKREQQNLFYVN